MLSASIPVKFNVPFASMAGGSFINVPIPVSTSTPYYASLDAGFPPDTSTAGGAPRIQDFNGILNQITAWNQWQQAGGSIPYDGTFQTAIGGYPKGAVIASVATFGLYFLSLVDSNTSDPDTGGANWASFYLAKGSFVSAPTAISSPITSVAHGLGVRPGKVSTLIICTTAELGYSIGDVVGMPGTTYTGAGGGSTTANSTWGDPTNVGISFGSIIEIANKSTGANAPITLASWNFIFSALIK